MLERAVDEFQIQVSIKEEIEKKIRFLQSDIDLEPSDLKSEIAQ
jgi:hypothetical protein